MPVSTRRSEAAKEQAAVILEDVPYLVSTEGGNVPGITGSVFRQYLTRARSGMED